MDSLNHRLMVSDILEIHHTYGSGAPDHIIKNIQGFEEINKDTLRNKIKRCTDKCKQMRKNKCQQLTSYLTSPFNPPKEALHVPLPPDQIPALKTLKEKTKNVVTENRQLKRKLEESNDTVEELETLLKFTEDKYDIAMNLLTCIQKKHDKEIKSVSQDKSKVKKELQSWEKKYADLASHTDSLAQVIDKTKEKLSHYSTRNVTKREKRSSNKIEMLRKENKRLHDSVRDTNDNINEINNLKKENQLLQRKLKYSQQKVKELKVKDPLSENQIEIQNLNKQIHIQQAQIYQLEQINDLMSQDIVHTFENGHYVSEIRMVIMTLVTECNVSIKRVNDVIKCVLKGLTGKIPERLPSHGALCRLMNEAKFIANQQVAKEIMDSSNILDGQCATLHNDGTTKHHVEYESYQVTLSDGRSLSMGMTEVSSQSGERNFEAFQSVVREMASAVVSKGGDVENIVAKLLVSIHNTMSDQGASNNVFFRMLESLRSDLLPAVVENWEELDEKIKQNVSAMSHFFCKLHILGNMELQCVKTAEEFEKNVVSGKNPFSLFTEQCGSHRLARTCSKAFTMRGSDQYGVAGLWQTYLHENNLNNKLINIEHSRLNTLFFQCGAVYYHREHIKDFLNKIPLQNQLLKSIAFDVKENCFLGSIRALGIIDKVITGPYWRILNSKCNILELNNDLELMREKLEDWSADASPLMVRGQLLFPDVAIHEDAIYDSLMASTDDVALDTYTQMALELFCQSCLLILERQAKDQLRGGKYFTPDPFIHTAARVVPTTNMTSERDFAQLDWLIRIKPAANVELHESIILWTNNKTSQWLDSLSVFLQDPDKLVNKSIKHLCRDPGHDAEWVDGLVTAVFQNKANSINTVYTVIYDEWPDDEWHFPLLKDMKSGDLIMK